LKFEVIGYAKRIAAAVLLAAALCGAPAAPACLNADERVTAFEHAHVVYFMLRFPVVATETRACASSARVSRQGRSGAQGSLPR
jgi:hypothetical protein